MAKGDKNTAAPRTLSLLFWRRRRAAVVERMGHHTVHDSGWESIAIPVTGLDYGVSYMMKNHVSDLYQSF